MLGPSLFSRYEGHFGELTIPEGIKELENGTLAGNVFYHTVRFPQSLKNSASIFLAISQSETDHKSTRKETFATRKSWL